MKTYIRGFGPIQYRLILSLPYSSEYWVIVIKLIMQADNSATCLVPEFVRSIAGYLAASRQLAHYQQIISSNPAIQELLSPQNCIKDSKNAFLNGVIQPLRQLSEVGKLQKNKQFIILLDSLGKPK